MAAHTHKYCCLHSLLHVLPDNSLCVDAAVDWGAVYEEEEMWGSVCYKVKESESERMNEIKREMMKYFPKNSKSYQIPSSSAWQWEEKPTRRTKREKKREWRGKRKERRRKREGGRREGGRREGECPRQPSPSPSPKYS